MSQPVPVEQPAIQTGDLSVILSGKVMIPMHCDACSKQTDISIDTLKQTGAYVCEHCASVHSFSDTEMKLMKMMLAKEGYHFAL